MIRRRGFLLIQLLLFLTCTLAMSAQSTVEVAISSQITVEPDGLLAECSTEVSNGAWTLYQKVETVCSVTMNDIQITDELDCHSEPFFPFQEFSAPPLRAVCQKFLTIPIVGNATYMTSATHRIYYAANALGLGTPPTDPCDFRKTNVFNGNVPHVFDVVCQLDPTPVGPDLFWTFGHTLNAITTTTIDPANVMLGPKEKQNFTANPATNTVEWSIDPQIGTIDQTGNYRAPDVITNTQTVKVNACNKNDAGDCGHATVTLVPVSVIIKDGVSFEVPPDGFRIFEAEVVPANVAQSVKWTIDPRDAGTLDTSFDPLKAEFHASGENTVPHVAVIMACSTFDPNQCAKVTVFVPVVAILISADINPLTASSGAKALLTVTVTGTTDGINWSPDPLGVGTSRFIPPNMLEYTAPSPAINSPEVITFTACLESAPKICSQPYILNLQPPVIPSIDLSNFPAGQNTDITITGTGFGAQPTVRVIDPRIAFIQTSLTTSPAGSIIKGSVSVPPLLVGEITGLTVIDTSTVPPLQSTVPISIMPVKLSVTIVPTNATLQETQSQTFTHQVSCLTTTGIVCSVAQGVSFSLNPGIGAITQDGLYTATASISSQTSVVGQGCSTVSAAVCAPFTITLVPIIVNVTPSGVSLSGGQIRQFAATVTGSSASTVTWSISPAVGNIDQTGIYKAPASVAVQQTVIVNACSTVDSLRCGSTTVTLVPDPVINLITPSVVTTGSNDFTLIVAGNGFAGNAVVQVNGSARLTTFINFMQLKATIPASDLTGSQPLSITVFNPTPSGAISVPVPLTLTSNPIPLINNLTPPRVIACDPTVSSTPCPSFKLIINGSFLSPDSVVQIAGNSLVTKFISANQLTATIPAANLTSSGVAPIGIVSRTGGPASNQAPLMVFRYGDLTYDNVIDASDLVALANILAGNVRLLDPTPGDVFLDGTVDASDLVTLANFLAGNIQTLPIIPDQTAFLFNAGATVTLSPPTFAGQTVGTLSDPLPLTLTNGGPTPLSISSITPSGDFIQQNICGNFLAANTSCIINVTFSPTAAGARTGTLTVQDRSINGPHVAVLSGLGIAPAPPPTATLPASVTFASQTVGTNSTAQVLTLTNAGLSLLSLSGINITNAEFSQSNNCGSALAPNTSCTINVTFSPAAVGSRSGALMVQDNASNGPQMTSLSGLGTAGVPTATLSVDSLTFATRSVGTISVAQSITLANTGPTALSISSIFVNSSDFSESDNCGSSLAPNSLCTINVTFSPAVTGTTTAILVVEDNAGDSPQTVSLSGTGSPGGDPPPDGPKNRPFPVIDN